MHSSEFGKIVDDIKLIHALNRRAGSLKSWYPPCRTRLSAVSGFFGTNDIKQYLKLLNT
jgi:hypothetical protein